MSGYVLDTNIASHLVKGDRPEIGGRVASLPMEEIAISVVTEAELLYGLAERNHPAVLAERIKQFLLRVGILEWNRDAAQAYAELRAACESRGITLAPLDLMIAAHAVAASAVLITRDKAFSYVPGRLKMEDWSALND
jgi:tRNA(fMet)-specific endonuclease VapC